MADSIFISYARKDFDPYLDQFQADLVQALHQSLPDPVRVFMDRELSAGTSWSRVVEEALRSSRAMIAIVSPQYLATESTGREWEFFRRLGDAESPAFLPVLPVLWAPSDEVLPRLPPALANVQLVDGRFPEVYREQGLRFLMKLRKYKDEYFACIRIFARHLQELVERRSSLDPATVPPLDHLPSAFQADPAPFPEPSAARGPRYVCVVILAPARDEVARVREDLTAYGSTAHDWTPFLPEEPEPALLLLQQVVTGGRFFFKSIAPGQELLSALDQAERMDNLVCVVVDPWAVRVEALHEALQAFDGRGVANAAVVVLWGHDAESSAEAGALEAGLRDALERTLARGRGVAFVRSARELQAEVAALLERLRMEVIEQQSRPRPAGPPPARPSVERIDIG